MYFQKRIRIEYRPDIDGLRGLAVTSVILFHLFPEFFPGGFIGVDFFFVISGYLISSILFIEIDQQHFSLQDFYARRIRRIFPALILVMTATLLAGYPLLLSNEYQHLGKHALAGSTFTSNFTLWYESGYFDLESYTKPFLHLWSLAIEEQFYIFWPIFIWIMWRLNLNRLLWVFGILLASFICNVALANINPIADFYSPLTRFWELLLGALLPLLAFNHSQSRQNFYALLGAILGILGILLISKDRNFPGFWALLPTLSAFFLILAGKDSWINSRLLCSRSLVWLGLISYPLYLWHWSLISLSYILNNGMPSMQWRASLLLISVVLSIGTYLAIEKPIRFGLNKRFNTYACTGGLFFVGLFGLWILTSHGLPNRHPKYELIAKARNEWGYPGNLKPFIYRNMKFYEEKSMENDEVLYIGDSNIEQYYPRIENVIKKNPDKTYSAIFATIPGCTPLVNVKTGENDVCQKHMEATLQLAITRPSIKRVVIGGLWYWLDNRNYTFATDEKLPIKMGSKGYDLAMASLSNYIAILTANKKEVTIVLNIPMGAELAPEHILERNLFRFPQVFQLRSSQVSLSKLEEQYAVIKKDLTNIALENKIGLIDPTKFLCVNDVCSGFRDDFDPIYKDAVHLRSSYAKNYATFIDLTILKN